MAPDFELVLLPDDAPGGGAKEDADSKGAAATKTKAGAAGGRREAPAKPEKVRLSSFRGESPVVLMFSSYT